MRAVLILSLIAAAAAGLSACESGFKAPYDQGVCYYVVPSENPDEDPALHVVARDQPQIEYCAARLEEMRVNFLRMGGSNRDIVGAYQGQFIFIDRGGVYFGKSLTGNRFFALARTGDGRLAVPGAIERVPVE